MNGNEIFKALVEEANKENERQAGKIIGKIISEAKENEKTIARQAYRRVAGRLTYHFVKYTLPETYRLTLRSTNSMNLNLSRYDMEFLDKDGKWKTGYNVYFANDGRELN